MNVGHIMDYKIYVYGLMMLISVFAVSGLNLNGIFKNNKFYESRVFIVLLIMILTYLSSSFLIDFIELV